tara:strand:- start:18 stop:392 length:375 start_codon:yes stop_codon:yes gene_type:complete
MMVGMVKHNSFINVEEEAEVFPVLALMVNAQSPHQQEETVEMVTVFNGMDLPITTTVPEEVEAQLQTLSVRDLVVNTEEVMVDKEALAVVTMRDMLAKHMQAQGEVAAEMEAEPLTTALQVVRV